MHKDIFQMVMGKVMTGYVDFVYRTSKVRLTGRVDLLQRVDGEKFVALFWHGDSFCLYPALKGLHLFVVVTRDRRGDYISEVCHHYGYQTFRIPDATDGGNHFFQIRKAINGATPSNIAITIDGPIGVYHVPKDFPLLIAAMTRRKVMPISVDVKRSVRLTKRWDKFKIPLPFNQIDIHFNEPMAVVRGSEQDSLAETKKGIVSIMEKPRS